MATELKAAKELEKPLKPLSVVIWRNGKPVRSIKLEDPRALYIEEFNRQSKKFGLTAKAG